MECSVCSQSIHRHLLRFACSPLTGVFRPVRPGEHVALSAADRPLPPLSAARRRAAPVQACAPSLSMLMSRLSHRSSWPSPCHPVGAYLPSKQPYAGRRDKYTSPSSPAFPLPPLPFPSHPSPNPSSSFDLLCSSLCFLRLPASEHRDL